MLSSERFQVDRTDIWYMLLSSSALVLQCIIGQLLEFFILISYYRDRVFFGSNAGTEKRTSGKIIKC